MSTSSFDERMQMSSLFMSDIVQNQENANASGNENEEEREEGMETTQVEVSGGDSSLSLNVSYKKEIRPLLDAIDKLRNMDIMKEGIQLPSIVVVGDQSSGKSSVLESLAGIKLPRGQGICTRVPLIMRLQSCADQSQTEISIEFNGIKQIIHEQEITSKIELATQAIAGQHKGISYSPIILHIKKVGTPDLTMVDLPGITRVPVGGQPADIHEQISDIIKHYISPKESIILNVLAANVDFPTCESIKMSQDVDEHGERTLAVVTKSDLAPEGLLEKVTGDAVNIGLGYVCVRNGIRDETNEEARRKEKEFFDFHPQLRKLDKSMVGIPVLAKKLMGIQSASIHRSLPDILKEIESMLERRQGELSSLPPHLCNPGEAEVVFVKLLNDMKESLKKIVIHGEFQQFADDPQMHCTARLREMFEKYYRGLCLCGAPSANGKFLGRETEMLEEAKGVGLPNFLPRSVFLQLVQHMVEEVSDMSVALASDVWDYLESVICKVVHLYCQCYPQLHSRVKRALQGLIMQKKKECIDHVKECIDKEKDIDFTLTPVYMETYTELLKAKSQFMDRLGKLIHQAKRGGYSRDSGFDLEEKTVLVEGIGHVGVADIMEIPIERLESAYEMQMSILAYWKVVLFRMGDGIPLHLQFISRKLVGSEFESQILKDVGGPNFGSMEKVLTESPSVATKRKSLMNSVHLLRESKTTVAELMHRNAVVV
uniref:TSA: Wollemia nobilis Ref_Wollemi_Transcript_14676_2408 transcribed RNA sequence n=1 Tax=Wollemia nobilis TaxID=56998 RepID=A0A0C9S6J8_9CONI